MKRTTLSPHLQALMFFTLAAICMASPVASAQAPSNINSGEATYTLTDQEVPPPPSGIVWGPTSENHSACDFARAGCPQSLRKLTIPSNTRIYGGYYVGGGTPTRGAGRCAEDGTWGWDYSGILFPKRIALNWTSRGPSSRGNWHLQDGRPETAARID